MTSTAPWMLYHNYLEASTSTVTASSTASGYAVANLLDRKTWTKWKSTGGATEWIKIDLGASYTAYPTGIAISGHDLYTQTAQFAVSHSTDDITYTGAFAPSMQPDAYGRNQTMMATLNPAWTAKRYWKIEFASCDAAITIGAICLGKQLTFPEYMVPSFDPWSLQLQSRDARSEGGNMLGQTASFVKRHCKLKFGEAGLSTTAFFDVTGTPSWDQFLRSYWSKGKAFWFAWDETAAVYDHWYCQPGANAKIGMPYITATRRNLSFEFDVLAEGFQV